MGLSESIDCNEKNSCWTKCIKQSEFESKRKKQRGIVRRSVMSFVFYTVSIILHVPRVVPSLVSLLFDFVTVIELSPLCVGHSHP